MGHYTVRLHADVIADIKRAAVMEGRSQQGIVASIIEGWLHDWRRHRLLSGDGDHLRTELHRLQAENAWLERALAEKLAVVGHLLRVAERVNDGYKAENSFDIRLEWAINAGRRILAQTKPLGDP